MQIVERLNVVLRASVAAEFGNKDSVDLAASSQRQSLGRLGRALSPTILLPARLANDASDSGSPQAALWAFVARPKLRHGPLKVRVKTGARVRAYQSQRTIP